MLTTKEAAELLDITPRRVQELIKNGALEARKASGVWLIDKDSVNARLRSVTKAGGRPPSRPWKKRDYVYPHEPHARSRPAGLQHIAKKTLPTSVPTSITPTPLLEYLAPIAPCRSTLSAFGGEVAVSRSRALDLHPCWQKQQSMFPTNSSSEISASPYPTSIGLDPKIPVSRGRILTSSIMFLTTSLCPSHPSPQRAKQPLQSPITPRTATFRSIGHARVGVEFCIRQERT